MARNVCQEKIFANFTTCLCGQNFYPVNSLSHIDDYTEDMTTFTALAKIYSGKYFCNTRVAGIGKIFVQRKFSAIRCGNKENPDITVYSATLYYVH